MNSIVPVEHMLVSQSEISLAHYERMCVAIAEAGAVDEVKDIRDKALALEEYSKQAKNTELESVVVRIRIRAERRAGELLRDMERARVGRPAKKGNDTLPFPEPQLASQSTIEIESQVEFLAPPTLAQLGISKPQSSRWQKLAEIPAKQFEDALAKTEEKLSTSGVIRLTEALVHNHRAQGNGSAEQVAA